MIGKRGISQCYLFVIRNVQPVRNPCYQRAEDVKTWLEQRDEDDPDNYDLGFVLKETGELIGMGKR